MLACLLSFGGGLLDISLRTSNEGCSFSISLQGSGQGCPQLRASDEHSFIVHVLRARRAPGRFLLILPSARNITGVVACLDASEQMKERAG